MTAAEVRIAAARGEAEARRTALVATLEEIKQRLAPGAVAHDAWEGAKDKGGEIAESAIDAVRQRPVAAAGVVAGTALFLARKPLLDLLGGLFSDHDKPHSEPKRKRSE